MLLRCIRHGELNPEKSPELTCKICCKLFVTAIKERQQAKQEKKGGLIQRWLDDRNKVGANQSHMNTGTAPANDLADQNG